MNRIIPLYFALSDCNIIKDDGEILLQDELIKLWNFLNMLKDSRYSTFILRSESDENLKKQYNFDTKTPELLAQCLFMTGEKGRICWSEKKFLDPEDVSRENFQSICEALHKSIQEGCRSGSENRMQKMQDFLLRNKEFCDAFGHIECLVSVYEKLPSDDRKKVNFYYLSLVHTINSHKYQKASSFVSVTTSPQAASQFANDATIYGWVPQGIFESRTRTQAKSIEYVVSTNMSVVKRLGLPCCDTPVYPAQKEISLRYGMLPHFIIGFKTGRNFYVNPAIFKSMDRMAGVDSFRKLCTFRRNLIQYGLDVDQSNFEDFCRKTNFKRYYTYDGDEYRLHNLY